MYLLSVDYKLNTNKIKVYPGDCASVSSGWRVWSWGWCWHCGGGATCRNTPSGRRDQSGPPRHYNSAVTLCHVLYNIRSIIISTLFCIPRSIKSDSYIKYSKVPGIVNKLAILHAEYQHICLHGFAPWSGICPVCSGRNIWNCCNHKVCRQN